MMTEEEVRAYLERLIADRDRGNAVNKRGAYDGGLAELSVIRIRVLLRVLGENLLDY